MKHDANETEIKIHRLIVGAFRQYAADHPDEDIPNGMAGSVAKRCVRSIYLQVVEPLEK